MRHNQKPTLTRAIIIQTASELFFEKGFSKTTSTEICKIVDISKGNLTFYFPTKEHILAVLVKMTIDFQWQEMENITDEGKSSLLAYCLELSTMAAVSDDVPEMRDFFAAAYSHPMTLDLIRSNDIEKMKMIFGEYTRDWSDERFVALESIVSGIEYATLMPTEHSVSLEKRIETALDTIMLMFGVPEQLRKAKIAKVLAMDYHTIGRRVYEEFKQYVTDANEHALDEILKSSKIRAYK